VTALALAGCGGSDGGGSKAAGSTTTSGPRYDSPPLRILVTNDDGVGAPGIDALVKALESLPSVQVTVVAPSEDKSGSGDGTTTDDPTVKVTRTASGHRARAVDGTPADSVNWALDHFMKRPPHVVVSGVNKGQNLGPLVQVSGTVGAARVAARRGIPALALSAGLGDPPDFAAGAAAARRWIVAHERDLLRVDRPGKVKVVKFEIPTCTRGAIRGEVTVPLARTLENRDAFAPPNCTSTRRRPADDVDAFLHGFIAVTRVDPALRNLRNS
jgi:5'-nucleotidase